MIETAIREILEVLDAILYIKAFSCVCPEGTEMHDGFPWYGVFFFFYYIVKTI